MTKSKKIAAGAIVLCLALVLAGGGALWARANGVASVVSLDVNPSIELSVNRSRRVIACVPLNEAAVRVLEDMEGGAALKGARLNVAVNAVVGALVGCGYLDGPSSALLITVEDADQSRGDRLRQELIASVDAVLARQAPDAAVLGQTVPEDAALKRQARENGISAGKAALVRQAMELNGELAFEGLAGLSVEELTDLIAMGAPGQPIGKDAALRAAAEFAGAAGEGVTGTVNALLNDLIPCYEVELREGGVSCRVEAFSGRILSEQSGPPAGTPENTDVGAEQARDAALAHAGVQAGQAECLWVERDWDDGRLVYEVEFWVGATEYDYTIDGATGAVRECEVGHHTVHPNHAHHIAVNQAPLSDGADIGAEAAKAAALTHAGVQAAQTTNMQVEREYDDGWLEYEVEFWVDGVEYEYTIDGATGAVWSCSIDHHVTAMAGQGHHSGWTGTTPTPPAAPTPADIGSDRAKAAALAHAGVKENQTALLRVKQDYDDGRLEYDVEFRVGSTGYDYTIDGTTGAVVSYETDSPAQPTGTAAAGADIGSEQAKTAALTHAGIEEFQTANLRVKQDYDDGRLEYEVQFWVGATEYDYTIDGASGTVVSYETDSPAQPAGTAAAGADIGSEQAKTAALTHAGIEESQTANLRVKQDYDDGRLEYEVKFRVGDMEYEYTIDGATGAILDFEQDWD